ncbi:metallophosphoesterase family protein [Streptococcus hongkongensis]|nr:hypothetical protein NC01_08980 [Streptococcus uberis]
MTKKIALISDIHGNLTALEEVILDAKKHGVSDFWLLGDFILPGHGDKDLLDLIVSLPNTIFIRGNWDDSFIEAIEGKYDLDHPTNIYLMKLSRYLKNRVTKSEIEFLKTLPDHKIIEAEGLKFIVMHNFPDKNWGGELAHNAKQENFDNLFAANNCDVVIYGHIHMQVLRYGKDGQLIINPGSVGSPYNLLDEFKKDLRAHYAILDIDDFGITPIFRKIPYSIEQELNRAKEKGLPFLKLYEKLIRLGISSTHDSEALEEIIEKESYLSDVNDFLKELRNTEN